MANVCCQPRLAPNQRCQTARRDRQTDNRVSRSANRNCLSAARAFLVPAPQACVRVGRSFRAVSAPSPRMRGGWSADKRTLGLLSRLRGATPALVRRGPSRCDRDPFRRSTVALSSHGPTLPSPAVEHGTCSDCPRQAVNAWRSGSGPPAVRFAPQPRDAAPCSVFQDRF